MKKPLIWAVLLFVTVVGVAAVSLPKKQGSGYIVRIGNNAIISNKELPLKIAQEKNFFQEAGISVQIQDFSSANLVTDALLRGDIDITPETSLIPFFIAQAIDPGKARIFAVSDITKENRFDALLVKPSSPIQTLTDLQDKKIGVNPGTTTTATLKAFLQAKGVDTASIQFIQLSPTEHLAALSSSSIDALYTFDPIVTTALQGGVARSLYESIYAEQINHNPLGGGLINTVFASQHPEEARRAVDAINRSYEYIHTNPKESRQISAKVFQLNQQVTDSLGLFFFRSGQKIDAGVVDTLIHFLMSIGELKTQPNTTNLFYR